MRKQQKLRNIKGFKEKQSDLMIRFWRRVIGHNMKESYEPFGGRSSTPGWALDSHLGKYRAGTKWVLRGTEMQAIEQLPL